MEKKGEFEKTMIEFVNVNHSPSNYPDHTVNTKDNKQHINNLIDNNKT